MSALVRWLLLRRLALERGRTLLTICGIALGVAVFVSIRLANHSAMTSFADTVDAVTGRANLSVQSAADGFADSLFVTLARHPGVEAAAPIVQVTALAWPGGPGPRRRGPAKGARRSRRTRRSCSSAWTRSPKPRSRASARTRAAGPGRVRTVSWRASCA